MQPNLMENRPKPSSSTNNITAKFANSNATNVINLTLNGTEDVDQISEKSHTSRIISIPVRQHRSGMLIHWGGKPYNTDVWPNHFDAERITQLKSHYSHVPEEFYTKTGLEVVTPELCKLFLIRHRDLPIDWHLQEQCSGNGRLSLAAYRRNLHVLFPVDYRYGWDLECRVHQELLEKIREELFARIRLTTPNDYLWTNASKKLSSQVLAAQRLVGESCVPRRLRRIRHGRCARHAGSASRPHRRAGSFSSVVVGLL